MLLLMLLLFGGAFKTTWPLKAPEARPILAPGGEPRDFCFIRISPARGDRMHTMAPSLLWPLRGSFELIFKAPGLTSGAKFFRADGALCPPDSLAYRSSSITLPWTRRT
jgi:hypothetical protein